MSDTLAPLGHFDDRATAEAIKLRLEAAGIPAVLVPTGTAAGVRLDVAEQQLDQARQVLEASAVSEHGNPVTLATFYDPMTAVMLRNQLAAEGIRAFVTGDLSGGGPFVGVGGSLDNVQLLVNEADYARALQILEAQEAAADDDPEEGSTAIKAQADVSAAGREEPTAIQSTTPGLGQGQAADATNRTATPAPTVADDMDEGDDAPGIAWTADHFATQSWRTAVLALVAFGLTSWWSCGFLLFSLLLEFVAIVFFVRLAILSQDLSPRGMRHMYAAMFFIPLNLLAYFLILFRASYFLYW